jgi:GTPase SAR1 family protein
MRDRQGFILVYDITNPASVDDLTDLYTQILRNKLINPSTVPTDTPLLPLILVGNKLDLAMERKVSHQRGKELAELWKCPHYETSAKTRTNVDEIFLDLVRQIVVEREEAVRARKASGSGRSVDGIAGEGAKGEDEDDSVGMGCCVIS